METDERALQPKAGAPESVDSGLSEAPDHDLTEQAEGLSTVDAGAEDRTAEDVPEPSRRGGMTRREVLRLLVVGGAGVVGGYVLGVRDRLSLAPTLADRQAAAEGRIAVQASPTAQAGANPTVATRLPAAPADANALAQQVLPPAGYTLPVRYGDVGPQLVAAGAFDLATFIELYKRNNQPLTDEQQAVLRQNVERPIVIDQASAYFLLNLLWALGLVNDNPILKNGPMVKNSGGKIEGYASTGGWTLSQKPVTKLYASQAIVKLTAEQQASVETVAQGAYRPCCNNPTSFPDCNHGMALLGLLELMAAQGASVDQMFTAAKQVNAFWFPQQAFEVATYMKAAEGKEWADADARRVVSAQFFSGQGSGRVRQYLESNGLRELAPSNGGSCGV